MSLEHNIAHTITERYLRLRDEAHENGLGTAPPSIALATAGDFDSKPRSARQLSQLPQGATEANAVQIVFCGGAAADKTFGWRLYGNKHGGPTELIAVGTGILGTQQVLRFPDTNALTDGDRFWADTLVITNDYWLKGILVSTGGHNSVAKVGLDGLGYSDLYVEITDADGETGDQAGNMSVFYSPF